MLDLVNQINQFIANPFSYGVEAGISTADLFIKEIQLRLEENPEAGKTLGPIMAELSGLRKALLNLHIMEWVDLLKGQLSIGHRPSAKLMVDLKLQGATHVLTLLCENEGALDIEMLADKQSLKWLWFPMNSATPPEKSREQELKALFKTMEESLNKNAKIYIHCSAGIHRTGMISYAFLRFIGQSNQLALRTLKELRKETSDNVGSHRVTWANSLFSQ